jgi:hypothetical protein
MINKTLQKGFWLGKNKFGFKALTNFLILVHYYTY